MIERHEKSISADEVTVSFFRYYFADEVRGDGRTRGDQQRLLLYLLREKRRKEERKRGGGEEEDIINRYDDDVQRARPLI